MQLKRNILIGATHGLCVWLVYGMVEFALACGVPLLFQPEVELLPWQLRPIALVFGVYAVLGVVLGGASGAVLAWIGGRREDSRPHQIAAALVLTVAFAVNLLTTGPLRAAEYVALVIAILLATLFARAIVSSAGLARVAFVANPLAVSLLLLTTPWVSRVALTYHSTILKTAASLLLLAVTLSLAALWHRSRSGQLYTLRRKVMVAGGVTLLLLSGVVLSKRPSTARANQETTSAQLSQPNVILITMDTVRADHLSVYGYERDTTPHLRDFARQATVYTRAISTSDQTLTTHASMFTGLYPSWHGAYVAPPDHPHGRPLDGRHTTLAEILHSHGYWTAAEIANYGLLAPEMGAGRGFAAYHARQPIRLFSGYRDFRRHFFLREGAHRLLNMVMDTTIFDAHLLRAADINQHVLAAVDRARDAHQPFFLFINYMDAHAPYAPPPPFDVKFGGGESHLKADGIGDVTADVHSGRHHISAAERSYFVSQYDGGIAYEDEQIGEAIARLRELGLFENTLIVITGDHGEAFGEHDLMQHEVCSVYQDLVHVPLLIKYPNQHETRQSDALVSQVDLMPTVVDVAGIPVPSGVQGRSLQSSRPLGSHVVYSESLASPDAIALSSRFQGVRRGMFVGSFKVITWTQGPPELYDLETDPNETRNQYRNGDPRAAALADQLSAWAAAAPPQLAQPHKLDKNSVERLKSLGYAQ